MALTTQQKPIKRAYRVGDPDFPALGQLQGHACIVCGRTRNQRTQLCPAGRVRTVSASGAGISWDVRACPEHEEGAR
ncbi:hypothetical protein [Streptomyces noursei]|uniref:Uncharacterized protein n=1 Tax=Streptomyces noursei TaxID=1971 RepID=A0A401QRT9_STRNR|nr:hypothetical protein [Streptomyces noursei]UWS77605.1 hypothetical protein N1H47_40680 [Streptomyces noursei]GCB88013.1 hypothetical protein SALB_00682 [Streptomyces noursei]